jgi:hypothetical protein
MTVDLDLPWTYYLSKRASGSAMVHLRIKSWFVERPMQVSDLTAVLSFRGSCSAKLLLWTSMLPALCNNQSLSKATIWQPITSHKERRLDRGVESLKKSSFLQNWNYSERNHSERNDSIRKESPRKERLRKMFGFNRNHSERKNGKEDL